MRPAALALALLLAGCSSGASDEAVPDDPAPGPAIHVTNKTMQSALGWTLAVAPPGGHPSVVHEAIIQVSFDVDENATALDIQMDWTCATAAACGMVFELYAPGNDPSTGSPAGSAKGTGMASFHVDDPEPGDWSVFPDPDGPSAQASGTATATVTYEHTAPTEPGKGEAPGGA